jgi:WD40 repeat protein
VCSGGWGFGIVRCSSVDGAADAAVDTHLLKITSLSTSADHRSLVFADHRGGVWSFEPVPERLYAHPGFSVATALSGDGRLVASCAQQGSLVVFDRLAHRSLGRIAAHAGEYCSLSWVGEELWSAGDDGTIKRWAIRGGELRLQHVLQAPAPLRMMKIVRDTWAVVEGANGLAIGMADGSTLVRLDVGDAITALDISAGRRYVAASVKDEVIVVDLERHAIATVAFGAPIRQLAFLDEGTLVFAQPDSLRTVPLARLDYEPFQLSPEPANRVSF